MAGRPRVLLLRPEPQASRMAAELADAGIDAVAAPMLAVLPVPDPVARILGGGPPPDVLVLTSAHAAAAIAADPRRSELAGTTVVAVGDGTAAAARACGFADVRSAGGDGETVVAFLLSHFAPDVVVVHAAARDRAVDVAARLSEQGRRARTAEVYAAEATDELPADVAQDLASGAFDVVAVASRRSAEAFRRALDRAGIPEPIDATGLAAISNGVAEPLRGAFVTLLVADQPTGKALAEGIVALARRVAKNR